ncbi:uncharacterized protein LOC125047124 [Penaeus chinensis]|uniref:uncharacterized protein LOC125047124 n=1 Tax=Penaeus chinensis TaxID=139456 RepID=UPI001FB77778|nr:uncharacterized protein LOC125047124 [Penaeus chinensis]
MLEYFEQLYHIDLPAIIMDASGVTIPMLGPPISEEPPTLNEIREAIPKLNGGKASVAVSGSIPPGLLSGVIIPLWEEKGDRWDCNNYCGITLLRIPGKVFTHILLKRICDHLLRHQKSEQCGFTPGKSTIDCILALRAIGECCR